MKKKHAKKPKCKTIKWTQLPEGKFYVREGQTNNLQIVRRTFEDGLIINDMFYSFKRCVENGDMYCDVAGKWHRFGKRIRPIRNR